MDTWKNLESWGWDAVYAVTKMIAEGLIGKIHNIKAVYIVAGNHDRTSVKRDIDSLGEAAKMIADILALMVDVPIHFNYHILNPVIDGVCYIMSHGHNSISGKEPNAAVMEYGRQDLYNVILRGHKHTREVVKGYKIRRDIVEKTVTLEGSNWRMITVAPMVTGGPYSLSLGCHSTAGLTLCERSPFGGINYADRAA